MRYSNIVEEQKFIFFFGLLLFLFISISNPLNVTIIASSVTVLFFLLLKLSCPDLPDF